MSTRIIRTEEELKLYQYEVRIRQYENNPVTVEFINDFDYELNKGCIKVTRINNHETIEFIRTNNLILEYLRYPHIFNVMDIPEEKIYI